MAKPGLVRVGCLRLGLLVGLAAGCMAGRGAAQDLPRTLTGHVTDHHHEPLKGAVVQVQNESTNSVVSYLADGNGFFSFKRLSGADDYKVWATYRGHRSKMRELSHFDSKDHVELELFIVLD